VLEEIMKGKTIMLWTVIILVIVLASVATLAESESIIVWDPSQTPTTATETPGPTLVMTSVVEVTPCPKKRCRP
jgi:hypothetical protein